jgi:nucleoid-associated protein YgaU
MRTTISLSDHLLAQAKKRASQEGITLSDLVASAVRERVLRPARATAGATFRLVEFGHGGLRPGVSWEQLKFVSDAEVQSRVGGGKASRAADER